jgi:hypothetical protein
MSQLKGICPCCLNYRNLTYHHIFPKRNYGRNGNNSTITLCKWCHESLERVISFRPSKVECVSILTYLLGGTNVRG